MPFLGFLAGASLSVHLREPPASSREEALKLFVQWFGDGESEERDALVDAFVDAWAAFASKQSAYASSADPRHATGSTLALVGTNRDMPKQVGETDEEYRARLLADEDVGTPNALLAAIDRIMVDTAASGTVAYYYERPDDDAFVFSKNHVAGPIAERGTYLHGKSVTTGKPIRKASRLFSARGRCQPRHVFLFPTRRNTANAPVSVAVAGIASGRVSIDIPSTDDRTAPDNARGHCVIGLPAFIQPGKSLSSDCAVHRTPTAPVTEAWGDLTAATRKRANLLSSVFTKATTATRVGLNKFSGPAIYKSQNHPDIIVGKIRAVLAHRAMSPIRFTLMFDPTLL